MSCDGIGICNGKEIPTSTKPIETDVCVIGAGPAGITAAATLAEAGFKVIVLDGSRQLHYPNPGETSDYYRDSWPDKEKLYAGKATGIFATNEPKFLTVPTSPADGDYPWERERVFGGTATHGGGQCRPQDLIDIEGRGPSFPKWPISYDELNGFYREASISNHLTGDYPENFKTDFWKRTLVLPQAVSKLASFDVEMYQWMGNPDRRGRWKNFATRPWGKSQKTIGQLAQVIVNATVLNIQVASGAVYWVDVASMEDFYPEQPMRPVNPKKATEFRIHASIYILACGAVENARQLLLSKIGNKDQVGHYFMCHPLSGWSEPMIRTTKPYLRDADSINLMRGYDKNGKWYDPSFGNEVEGRFITNPDTTKRLGIGRCWFWANDAAPMYFEMAPNYESAVTLDEDGPPDTIFGQKRTKINWKLTDTDKKTYEENCKEFKKSAQALGGDIWYPTWDEMSRKWVPNGHHMGTTRMSAKPEDGVVDPDLKVHELSNLYVAGSSVFPTGGISNPTMTIVALSLRLASHVQRTLSGKAKA